MSVAAEVLGPRGPLAGRLRGFEHREGQVEMAARVEETLNRGGHFMVEAGTGVGKSFAYLVPALFFDKLVVISTATRNLQDQLFDKDLPQLQAILGTRVPVARMKGRENYLCKREWGRFSGATLLAGRARRRDLKQIARWAEVTRTGDRDQIPGIRGPLDFWRGISTVSENCVGRRCAHHDDCHLTRLRKRAHTSRILIVNHYLLVADLMVRERDYGQVLPDYDHLIVDEAHRLEGAATHSLSTTLTSAGADRLVEDAERFFRKSAPSLARPRAATSLRSSYRECFLRLEPEDGEDQRIFDGEGLPPGVQQEGHAAAKQLQSLEDRLEKAREWIRTHAPEDAGTPETDPETDAERLLKRTGELRTGLETLLRFLPDHVHWSAWPRDRGRPGGNLRPAAAPRSRKRTLFVTAAPIHPGDQLGTGLFGELRASVLTSATLAVGDRFDYSAGELGVPEVRGAVVASPFRYREQARLFVPGSLVPPNHPRFLEEASGVVLRLIHASQGRAMVLFTSWKNLVGMERRLKAGCSFPVLRQQDRGHRVLLEQFRNQPNAVLLATRAFWEGVDVPGEALTLLVIDKLPFPVPTEPLHWARAARAREETGSEFFGYSVPQTALVLKQGLGRLIRSRRDVGLAAVLDSRLVRKPYGRVLRRSLPGFPVIERLEEAARFLEELP